jgi:hypothetical protein
LYLAPPGAVRGANFFDGDWLSVSPQGFGLFFKREVEGTRRNFMGAVSALSKESSQFSV